jgi:hypothetical protein
MPRVRRGPNGPKKSLAGKRGTNKSTPHRSASTSGLGHEKRMTNKGTGGIGGGGTGGGY